jgi:hypothetical protein
MFTSHHIYVTNVKNFPCYISENEGRKLSMLKSGNRLNLDFLQLPKLSEIYRGIFFTIIENAYGTV